MRQIEQTSNRVRVEVAGPSAGGRHLYLPSRPIASGADTTAATRRTLPVLGNAIFEGLD